METDQQAIARLKRGDIHGLEALVQRYQLRATRAACLIVNDPALAQDIVQSAYLRASERIHQFDEKRPFGPWFFRMVVNDAIKAAKRQSRQTSLEARSASSPMEWLTDPTPLPDEQAESEETRQAVRQALEQLPPQQRAAIVLRYYLDMGEAEMSQEMRKPVGTIKWLLSAARKRLRLLLAEPTAHPDVQHSPDMAGPGPRSDPWNDRE